MQGIDARIAAGLKAGRTQAQLARELGCSSSNITQHINRNPDLWKLRRNGPTTKASLSRYRTHLAHLEHDARNLARRLRRALDLVDAELIDREINEALE